MKTAVFSVYNPLFLYASLLWLVISVGLFFALRNNTRLDFRISLVSASVLAVAASMMPKLAVLITLSFVPAFVYHLFKPLLIAPYVVMFAGCLGIWSGLVLLQEFAGFVTRAARPPQFAVSLLAMLIFVCMGFKLYAGIDDYTIIVNAAQIVQYAKTGANPSQLKRLYTEVALSHDIKLLDDVLSAFALNHHTPPELLRVVYLQTLHANLDIMQKNYVLVNLSKNPNTSADLLKKLLLSVSQIDMPTKNDTALAAVSHNPNFSPDLLNQWENYPDCEIRRTMIAYPNISEDVLTKMIAQDPDVGVRHDAKRRLDFLHGISHLDTDKVRPAPPLRPRGESLGEMARHQMHPDQLQAIFAASETDDHVDTILENLASNCYMTPTLLQPVYERAITLKGYSRTAILMALAMNPQTPLAILQKLADEKDLMILRALASNPSLPAALIDKFAPYPDCKIRKELVCMPQTNRAVLKQLQHDADESVAQEAAERLREEETYLTLCREMKKWSPSCQHYFGNAATPDLRMYPNTSLREAHSVIRQM